MGRVKRYKKVKACDPFAKNHGNHVNTTHDEPPNVFEEKSRRVDKRARRIESNEVYQLRKFAKLSEVDTSAKSNSNKKVIEGKRDGESMKTFKKRLRQETRETLRDEVRSLTSTAKKRKQRLKERKLQKKKGKAKDNESITVVKNHGNEEEKIYEREFGASERGKIRASDFDDAKMQFDEKDHIAFGERVEAPPDLRFAFKLSGARKIGLGKNSGEASSAGKRFVEMQQNRSKLVLSASDKAIRNEGILHNSNQTPTSAELDIERSQAIAAYKDLQRKRKMAEHRAKVIQR